MELDLLSDPILTVVDQDGARTGMSLPGLFAAWSAGRAVEMAHLRAHQRHSWHAFCVQVAALALEVEGATLSTPLPTDGWREMLQRLCAKPGAWSLLPDRDAAVGFMQPPAPDGVASWKTVSTPDALDIVLATRAHDVKPACAWRCRPEHWVFALVSAQTSCGFGGPTLYGIARMAGGFGSRPAVGLVPRHGRTAARFVRDVRMAQELALTARKTHGFAKVGRGERLLWTLPWRGAKDETLALADLHPLFIDCARRVRLARDARGSMLARTVGSAALRAASDEARGDTADAWAPVHDDSGRVLTVRDRGFHYGLVAELLQTRSWRPAPAMAPRAGDGPVARLQMEALARGKGRTDGYHTRALSLPAELLGGEGLRRLGDRSAAMVRDAAAVRVRGLRVATLVLLQGAPARLDLTDRRADRWTADFDARVDAVFFVRLASTINDADADAARAWRAELGAIARDVLTAACARVPVGDWHRSRVEARAGLALHASLAKLRGAPVAPTTGDRR